MARQDYYETLGVARGASQDEIKRAYRALARKYHPDVNKDPDAQKRFTQVQQAYDVLSDEKQREAYDRLGHAAYESGAGGAQPGRGAHYSWTNVGEPGRGGRPEDLSDISELFETFFGGARPSGGRASARQTRARRHTPEPTVHDLTVDFETAARGGSATIAIAGRGRRQIEVKIPRGVASGAKLRVPASATGSGDVLIRVHVTPHPLWRRRGDPRSLDLEMDLPLSLTEAVFGARIPVPTLDGTVDLTIPPGAGGGKALRVKGQGLEAPPDQETARGDLFVFPRVVAPPASDLGKDARRALEELQGTLPSPRTGPAWQNAARP